MSNKAFKVRYGLEIANGQLVHNGSEIIDTSGKIDFTTLKNVPDFSSGIDEFSFNTASSILTLGTSGGSDFTVDLTVLGQGSSLDGGMSASVFGGGDITLDGGLA